MSSLDTLLAACRQALQDPPALVTEAERELEALRADRNRLCVVIVAAIFSRQADKSLAEASGASSCTQASFRSFEARKRFNGLLDDLIANSETPLKTGGALG